MRTACGRYSEENGALKISGGHARLVVEWAGCWEWRAYPLGDAFRTLSSGEAETCEEAVAAADAALALVVSDAGNVVPLLRPVRRVVLKDAAGLLLLAEPVPASHGGGWVWALHDRRAPAAPGEAVPAVAHGKAATRALAETLAFAALAAVEGV